jgi:DNA-directed RNA polymerase subunit M/transcription elongation factor TFIIS
METIRTFAKEKLQELMEFPEEDHENGSDPISSYENELHGLSKDNPELYLLYLTRFIKYGSDYRKSREELDPEKWSKLKDLRLQKETKINKKKGLHRCPKCKSWFTVYQQLQTASADESMRVSVSCTDCGHHWKYS